MHIDIWCPIHILEPTGNRGILINVMCNIMQFVISTPTYNITAENLTKLFMVEVFLNFGTCAVIVVNNGSTFKGNFQNCAKPLILPVGASR